MTDSELESEDQLTLTEHIRIITRTYFSISHIQSAALFARQCGAIERLWPSTRMVSANDLITNQARMDAMSDAIAYAIGAIFMARAFIEAAINEFVLDIVAMQERPAILSEVGQTIPLTEQRAILAQLPLIRGKKRDPVRRRQLVAEEAIQMCLSICGKSTLDETTPPYSDVKLLRELRNHFIHYEVLSVVALNSAGAVSPPERLESEIAACGCATSPFPATGLSRYLSHSCAVWAVASVDAFAREFYTRMGVRVLYDHVSHRLTAI